MFFARFSTHKAGVILIIKSIGKMRESIALKYPIIIENYFFMNKYNYISFNFPLKKQANNYLQPLNNLLAGI